MDIIKPEVNLYGLWPEMVLVDSLVRVIFHRHNQDCIITSAVRDPDGKSLHGVGLAIDYRATHIISDTIRLAIFEDLQIALHQCDVLLHGDPVHFHVEYDDKLNPLFQRAKEYYKQTKRWPV